MLRRWLLVATVAAAAALAAPPAADDLEDFDTDGGMSGWVFNNGPEFPGASGSMTAATGHAGAGAALNYDFTGGGAYTQLIGYVDSPRHAAALRLWVRGEGPTFAARTFQSLSQALTLQFEPARPFDALRLNDWFCEVIALDAPAEMYGTGDAGDPAVGITLIGALHDPMPKVGSYTFDDLALLSELRAELSPLAASVPTRYGGGGGANVGVRVELNEPAAHIALAADAGFTVLHVRASWPVIEPTAGTYDFSQLDAIQAAAAGRMRLHLVLGEPHPAHSDQAGYGPKSPATRAAFAAYASALASRYPQAEHEIWRQPNRAATWPSRDAGEYRQLVQEAYDAIKAQSPSAAVISGAYDTEASPGFLAPMLADGGLAVDAFAIVGQESGPNGPESITWPLMRLQRAMQAGGGQLPVRSTESQWCPPEVGDGAADAYQALWFTRELLTAWAIGYEEAAVGELTNAGPTVANAAENCGHLTSAGTPKASLRAIAQLLSVARARTFTGIVPSSDHPLHVLKFTSPRDVVLVVWSSSPGVGAPVRVSVPGPVEASDLFGQRLATVPDTVPGRVALDVTRIGGPVYLRFPGIGCVDGGACGPLLPYDVSCDCAFGPGSVPVLGAVLLVVARARRRNPQATSQPGRGASSPPQAS